MVSECSVIAEEYRDEINKLLDIQMDDNREAIFFIYQDNSTSSVFSGEPTQISLTREEEARIMSQGRVVGSVHTHPSGADPSTIDIMTGIMTQQESMCVAMPAHDEDVDSRFVLTCLDLSKLNFSERRRLLRAMRRSSVGITDLGREFRKQAALSRFKVDGCRTHEVKIDGFEFPVSDRPSRIDVTVGKEQAINEVDGDEEYADSP